MPREPGGMHGTVADPKIIFKEALDRRASSIVSVTITPVVSCGPARRTSA